MRRLGLGLSAAQRSSRSSACRRASTARSADSGPSDVFDPLQGPRWERAIAPARLPLPPASMPAAAVDAAQPLYGAGAARLDELTPERLALDVLPMEWRQARFWH